MRQLRRRLLDRLAALVVTALVVAVSLLGFAAHASAAALPVGSCTTTANVVVAVDFAHWGGPIVRACGSTPTTGYELLNQGGFHTLGTQHDGPGFVCRISSSSFGGTWYPAASEPGESCVLTPPATGYWSYWHADAGRNSWSYSSTGATSASPGPGSVDLWVFGATSTGGGSGSGVPSFSPDAVRARNADPTPTHPATTHAAATPARPPTHPAADSPSRAARTTPAARSASAAPTETRTRARAGSTPARRTTAAGARATSATVPAPTVSATTRPIPTVIDAKPVAAKRASSGSAWPVIAGMVIAAFLAGGAGLTVLRRRRST